MHSPIFRKQLLAMTVAMLLLAGCASTPAPVVNHSFGSGQAAQKPVATAQPAKSGSSVQTFGLGHANGNTSAAGYTVAPGDTLYSIAFAHGIDFRALAAQNDIPPPYTIHPGQVLRLQHAAATTTVVAAPVTVAPAAPAPAAQPVTTPASTPPPSAPVFGPVTTQTMTAAGVAPAASASVAATPVPAASASVPPAPVASAASAASQASPPVPVPASVPSVPTPSSQATRSVAGVTWQWPASGKVVGSFQPGAGGDGAGLDIAGNLGDPVRAAAAGTVVYSGNGLIGYGELVIIKHNDTYLSAYGHNSKRLVKEGQHVDAGQEIALMGASGAPRVELHFEVRKDGKPVDPMAFLPQR